MWVCGTNGILAKQPRIKRSIECPYDHAVDALECGTVVVLKEEVDADDERYVYLGHCKKLNVFGRGGGLS